MGMPDELPEDLQTKLNEYHKALEEEFNTKTAVEINEDSPEIIEKTRGKLIQEIPASIGMMAILRDHAKSETVRFQASKYFIDNGLGKGENNVSDPVEDLIKKLNATAT